MTVRYKAPEQAMIRLGEREKANKCDVYTIALVLLECLDTERK